ncbi:MAG: response regulator [Candidatus Vogelbacteria bacterium CG22_combo_CG10-13_8_21_14_all_37_9]|uniref:Response regulator n=1 Tax=Candidatus Vogelbacteria bacterium CG22_combo_CG10-13_8_21_14_all_37_9 TaxID=1975046 RepID=A0A2H0BL33_9BACT|nr:MAG: response regulator [Candidatus Vogelbacteria bacterium CG22_combo_CG10-13_8_21_14_all_37_9]
MMAKILLIDDEADLLFLYTKALMADGFSTIMATDAETGLIKAKNEKPDLILLDLVMKPIDGFKIFSDLKKDLNTAKIPVIILTNLTRQGLYDEMINKGAVAFLEKTDYAPDEISAKIKSILQLS